MAAHDNRSAQAGLLKDGGLPDIMQLIATLDFLDMSAPQHASEGAEP